MEVKDYENAVIGLLVFLLGYQVASYGSYIGFYGDLTSIWVVYLGYMGISVGIDYMCNEKDEITVD